MAECTGRDAIGTKQVRSVAPIPAAGFAAANIAIGNDSRRQHDVARSKRRANLLDRLSRVEPGSRLGQLSRARLDRPATSDGADPVPLAAPHERG